jgi:hypothetical protein
METINAKLYTKLASLSRDELYEILKEAGIVFTEAKCTDLTKEELLLVADEADMALLSSLLGEPVSRGTGDESSVDRTEPLSELSSRHHTPVRKPGTK